jgi:hypothetical protein
MAMQEVFDAKGRRVLQKSLYAPFKMRGILVEQIHQLVKFVTAVRSRDMDNLLHSDRFESEVCPLLEKVIGIIEDNVPQIPCTCHGNEDCTYCLGKKWLTNQDMTRLTGRRAPRSKLPEPSAMQEDLPTETETKSTASAWLSMAQIISLLEKTKSQNECPKQQQEI